MHILNHELFSEALKASSFKTIKNLAAHLGIHRNTIQHYLAGAAVIPDALDRALETLGLNPSRAFIKKTPGANVKFKEIAPIASAVSDKFPDVILVLFGSRARGTNRKYSDFDLGVYSSKSISHREYTQMIAIKESIEEDLPFFVDLINLNSADTDFIKEISKDWIFLSGNIKHWIDLQLKAQDGG